MASKKKRNKRKLRKNDQIKKFQKKPAAATQEPSGSGVEYIAEIRRLISKDKTKDALKLAKVCCKQLGEAEFGAVLVDAYAARIDELSGKGLTLDAETLLEMVRKRQDLPDDRYLALKNLIFIREGRLEDFVKPLNDPETPQDTRVSVEKMIQRELIDLNALAGCKTLPLDYPLRQGAAAAARAFSAVTSGPVEDEAIELTDIPRRSPLAPWKMLLRALDCFYRHDDALCEKYLSAVDPESVPARLIPAVRAMVSGEKPEKKKESTSLLTEKINADSKPLYRTLQTLDDALAANKASTVLRAIRNAVNACKQAYPEFVETLKQHISIRCWMRDFEADEINGALGGPSLKNAYFWRLYARAAEIKGQAVFACALWEAFRKHSVEEGQVAEKSIAEAVIYVHMADLLKNLPPRILEQHRNNFNRQFKGFELYYPELVRLGLKAASRKKSGEADLSFLYPEHLYRLATDIDPDPEIFRLWLDWAQKNDLRRKKSDSVALSWHAGQPDDPRPLLALAASAEKRNAFRKALGYLDKAVEIDGLNPEVKRSRLRLLTSTAVRHLRQRKNHLVQKDICEMDALPQSAEGDRPAFLTALKSVCALLDRKHEQYGRLFRELVDRLESKHAASLVLSGLLKMCEISETADLLLEEDLPEGEKLAAAVDRGKRLCDDMGVSVAIPSAWRNKMREFFTTDKCRLDPAVIRSVAQGALLSGDLSLTYAASGAGLLQPGAALPRFLLLRARSLPSWDIGRKYDCIAVAIELARRERDMDLIDEAVELQRTGNPFFMNSMNNIELSIEPDKLDAVLQRETETRAYPTTGSASLLKDPDEDDDMDLQCMDCDVKDCASRRAPYMPDAFDMDDDDNDDFPDDDDPDEEMDFFEEEDEFSGLPPELVQLMWEAMLKHGGDREGLPDPEKIRRKDPKLFKRLLEAFENSDLDRSQPEIQLEMPGFRRKSKKSRGRR